MKVDHTFIGMKRISSGGLAVYEAGSGQSMAPPLVLLHGFCEDARLWQPLLPALERERVLLVELSGFGASPLAPVAGVAEYAAAVADTLDALGVGRFVVVGHSLGGYVALELAAQHSQRLAGLGLFHSHPFADTPERVAARRRGLEMLHAGKRDLYVAQLFPNLFTPAYVQAHPEVLQASIEMGKRQSAEGIGAALEAMISRRDHCDTLRAATCPVLFLLGAEDQLVPLDSAWQTALLPPLAQVEVMQGVAHMGMYESPAACGEKLAEFYSLAISNNF